VRAIHFKDAELRITFFYTLEWAANVAQVRQQPQPRWRGRDPRPIFAMSQK
jgi:hypothetical protein